MRNVYDLDDLIALLQSGKECELNGYTGRVIGMCPESGNKHNRCHSHWSVSMEFTCEFYQSGVLNDGTPVYQKIPVNQRTVFVVAKKG
jgi:hypothetical protein